MRLTVWQNLLIAGVPDARVAEAVAAIEALELATRVSPLRAGLVACTGNFGCRFAAADTKRHAAEIASFCETTAPVDTPINIGARVPVGEEGDTVEGYNILVGGGFAEDAAIARELYSNVKADEAPHVVARILRAFVANRADKDETFVAFARRNHIDAIRRLADAETLS